MIVGGGGGGGGGAALSPLTLALQQWRLWGATSTALSPFAGAGALTFTGTNDTPALAVSAVVRTYLQKRRSTSANTTANTVCQQRATVAGDGVMATATAAGAAGFLSYKRFGTPTVAADQKFFAGFLPGALTGATEPSAHVNILGVGKDTTDTNLQFMANDGSGTASKLDTGLAYTATMTYDLWIYVPRGGGSAQLFIYCLDTLEQFFGEFATNLPALDTYVFPTVAAANGAGGVAVAVESAFWMQSYPLIGVLPEIGLE